MRKATPSSSVIAVAAGHAAGDEVARVEILADRADTPGCSGARPPVSTAGSRPPLIHVSCQKTCGSIDVPVIDEAVGRQRMRFQGGRHQVGLADLPFATG